MEKMQSENELVPVSIGLQVVCRVRYMVYIHYHMYRVYVLVIIVLFLLTQQ